MGYRIERTDEYGGWLTEREYGSVGSLPERVGSLVKQVFPDHYPNGICYCEEGTIEVEARVIRIY